MSVPRILHITESLGGGVASAIEQYARSSSHLEHHLVAAERKGDYARPRRHTPFASTAELPRNPFAAVRVIRDAVRRTQPQVVHAHSSFGGFLMRTALRRSTAGPRLLYTPHCYAFEREDLPRAVRGVFKAVEWLLAWNTDTVVACSEREERLARSINRRVRAIHVPNVSGVSSAKDSWDVSAELHLVGGGRFSAQKDPELFARIVAEIGSRRQCRATWVGGNRDEIPLAFSQLPIEVTGWLPREEAISHVVAADVYVHTAAWEGFPMAVLEAIDLGLPVVARGISALDGGPPEFLFKDASEAATHIMRLGNGTVDERRRANAAWRDAFAENTIATQARLLARTYSDVAHTISDEKVEATACR